MLKLVILCVVLCMFCNGNRVSGASSKPHVVVILADDLGFDDVGFHDSPDVPTPNLDALAYDGILLSNYYIQPICTPSRSALMTGKHPIHLGLQSNVIYAASPYGLGLNETIFPQYMKELGYATHMVGKWHLGFFAEEYLPTKRGFDTHFGYYTGKEDYFTHENQAPAGGQDGWGLDFWDNEEPVQDEFGQYSAELFTERAVKIIHEHDAEKPLFMYLPYQSVHSANEKTPLQVPWKYEEPLNHIHNKKRRTFAGMVSALDSGVGNVTQALADKSMLENTIIIFTTDNGGPAAGFDMNHACNYPLRGVKATLWEGGVRGSGFIWSKLLAKTSRTSNQMVQIIDWLPTVLSAAGYDMNKLKDKTLDGVDQWEALSKDSPSIRNEMLHNIDPLGHQASAIRLDNYKLVYNVGHSWDGWYQPESVSLEGQMSSMIYEPSKFEVTDESRSPGTFLPQGQGYVNEDKRRFESNQIEQEQIVMEQTYQNQISRNSKQSVIESILYGIGRDKIVPRPLKIECGQKPANASTNCNSMKAPCLYDIADDPCEYHNIADKHPDVVQKLMARLEFYRKTMVPPLNKPADPNGYPGKHGNLWKPWVKL